MSVSVTAVIGAAAVWAVGLPGMALDAIDARHDARAAKMFVSVEFIERQQYDQQIYQYDQDLNRNELEMARPGTTPAEKSIYIRQNQKIQRQKEDVIRDWKERNP